MLFAFSISFFYQIYIIKTETVSDKSKNSKSTQDEKDKTLMYSLIEEYGKLTDKLEELLTIKESEDADEKEVSEEEMLNIGFRMKDLNSLISILINRRFPRKK
jgi:plasmid rolling circle replication initiator protein Rep